MKPIVKASRAFALGIIAGLGILSIFSRNDADGPSFTSTEEAAVRTDEILQSIVDVVPSIDEFDIIELKDDLKPTKDEKDLDDFFEKNKVTIPTDEINIPTKSPTNSPTMDNCLVEPSNFISSTYSTSDLKFFIVSDFGTDDLIQCLLDELQVPSLSVQSVFEHPRLHNSISPILSDMFLLEELKASKNRVFNKTNADFIVLNMLPTLSYFLDDFCQASHKSRTDSYTDVIYKMSYTPQPLFFALSYPVGSKTAEKMIGATMFKTLFRGNLRTFVGTTNKHVYSKIRQEASHNAIILPQLSKPVTETVSLESKMHCLHFDEIITTVSVSKVMKKLGGEVREILNFRGQSSDVQVNKYATKLIAPRRSPMSQARFCLVLNGVDGIPGKNRVSEALNNNCVPIIVQSDKVDLPFENTIDWFKNAVFFEDLQCIEERVPFIAQQIADYCRTEFQPQPTIKSQLQYSSATLISSNTSTSTFGPIPDSQISSPRTFHPSTPLVNQLLLEMGVRLKIN